MSERQAHITILIGSPKGIEKSTSARLARQITVELEAANWTTEWFHAHHVVRSEEAWEGLLTAMVRSDVLLLAAPLYVDSLPAPLIETLHRLLQAKSDLLAHERIPPRFLPLLNCGFVEPRQNQYAQLMLHSFCRRMGFQWAEGISLGGGGMVNKRIRNALQLAAAALRDDILIPDSVEVLTRAPIMKPWLYVLGGNFMWKRQAKANNLLPNQLKARPYRSSE